MKQPLKRPRIKRKHPDLNQARRDHEAQKERLGQNLHALTSQMNIYIGPGHEIHGLLRQVVEGAVRLGAIEAHIDVLEQLTKQAARTAR